jgi:hypothetical protein
MVARIWALFRKMCTSNVVRINPVSGTIHGPERTIFVGPDAALWQKSGNLLASNAANIFYAVVADEK